LSRLDKDLDTPALNMVILGDPTTRLIGLRRSPSARFPIFHGDVPQGRALE
jgi:hypothetical protein